MAATDQATLGETPAQAAPPKHTDIGPPYQGLSEWQVGELSGGLAPGEIKYIGEGRDAQPYVDGTHVVHELNRVFGFGGWEVETLENVLAGEWPYFTPEYTYQGKVHDAKRGLLVSYRARVRLTIHTDEGIRSYVGSGIGSQVAWRRQLDNAETVSPVQAHTTAYKGAETDALKRAAAMLGDRFGLNLRDKDARQGSGGGQAAGNGNGQRQGAPAQGAGARNGAAEELDFSTVGGLLNAMTSIGVKGRATVELARDRTDFKGMLLEDLSPDERKAVYLAAKLEKETVPAG